MKELGPLGPGSADGNGYLAPESADSYHSAGMLSPANSDLHLLISGNEEEVSEEMLTFHEAIIHMQEQEEQVIDAHRDVIEVWFLHHFALLLH